MHAICFNLDQSKILSSGKASEQQRQKKKKEYWKKQNVLFCGAKILIFTVTVGKDNIKNSNKFHENWFCDFFGSFKIQGALLSLKLPVPNDIFH